MKYFDGNICPSIGYKRPTHYDVYKYVVPRYAHKWRFLGKLLKFDEAELMMICSNCYNDSQECFMMLFSIWLREFPDASWDHLLSAIDDLVYQGMILIGVSLRKHHTISLRWRDTHLPTQHSKILHHLVHRL